MMPYGGTTRPKTAKTTTDLNFLRFHTVWAGSEHSMSLFKTNDKYDLLHHLNG